MRSLTACALLTLALLRPCIALGVDQPQPFSASQPGSALPAAWHVLSVPHKKSAEFTLVDDAGTTVMRADAQTAVGSLAQMLRNDLTEKPVLQWRWKVAQAVKGADLSRKSGDDFAARVYVFFDVPLDSLPFTTRMSIKLARLLYGQDLPTAVICYVWDNTHPTGHVVRSAYTDRVKLFVLQSGDTHAGQWQTETRDLVADFRAAFGHEWNGPPPAITGVAVGSDTDQTGEHAVGWFGDLRFLSRP